ncbi:MAG: pyridoxal 5'-phosphate synthase glutaminase subunit PdxT [Candidatus Zixiibacteriota bacterium]|nr:MAG: pyridoxal 5'-phosphate synthase glutaminase subunit PdxT [candidate division Zixibacteria bacterium]
MSRGRTIGVLALQGDFERHLFRLSALGMAGREVRRKEDLTGLDGLIIPGGESTTMSELIDRFKLRDNLEKFCSVKPVWGTCAGMILLAGKVDDERVRPLKVIDVSVIRNGYGRQINSFFAEIQASLNGDRIALKASFIRAPVVSGYGPEVQVLATYRDSPVLLAQGNCLISSFHTELHDDLSLTRYFLEEFVTGVRQSR